MSRSSGPGPASHVETLVQSATDAAETVFQAALDRTGLKIPYYVRKNTLEAQRSMDELAEKDIGPRITEFPLTDYKTSDTLFVLGSGSSINDISDDQWTHIARHDAVGLNRWPVHDFTPTYHVFELGVGPEYDEFTRTYWKLLNHRKEEYRDIPLILKDASRVRNELEPRDLPAWLRGDLIVSADTSFYPAVTLNSSVSENERLLQYLDDEGYFETGKIKALYRMRGSISYLIHLGTVLGYEKIVLCGVDMVDSMYFFDAEPYGKRDVPIPRLESRTTSEDEEHKTNDPDAGSLTLEQIIYSMNDVVLEPRNIELYVENDVSALHPRIPRYEY